MNITVVVLDAESSLPIKTKVYKHPEDGDRMPEEGQGIEILGRVWWVKQITLIRVNHGVIACVVAEDAHMQARDDGTYLKVD